METNKQYIIDDPTFRTLFENTAMLVGHSYETAYYFNKLTQEKNEFFEFAYDPTCGVIGRNSDWCLVGGDVLVLRILVDNALWIVEKLEHICEIRAIDDYKVQVLTDPWSDDSAIWELCIDVTNLTAPVSFEKIRAFKEYIDKPYIEKIEW